MVGTLVYGAGQWAATLVLLAFFVPSVLLSRVGKARKRELVDIGKGGPRDALQVLANGGIATACIVVSAFDRQHSVFWMIAFGGALAAATADTWGTEIGTLSRRTPRSIITGKPIATGLSGGVTWRGTSAEITGAVFIGTVAGALWTGLAPHQGSWDLGYGRTANGDGYSMFASFPRGAQWFGAAFIAVSGFAGALTDSILGETLQDRRWCPSCRRECETDPHSCGTSTERRRGLSWISNDGVNFAATGVGALLPLAIGFVAPAVIRWILVTYAPR